MWKNPSKNPSQLLKHFLGGNVESPRFFEVGSFNATSDFGCDQSHTSPFWIHRMPCSPGHSRLIELDHLWSWWLCVLPKQSKSEEAVMSWYFWWQPEIRDQLTSWGCRLGRFCLITYWVLYILGAGFGSINSMFLNYAWTYFELFWYICCSTYLRCRFISINRRTWIAGLQPVFMATDANLLADAASASSCSPCAS